LMLASAFMGNNASRPPYSLLDILGRLLAS
jgi:hypothetical protein